jgi:NAD(P)-dependent dehydrogenase (short-subunit alcohol dehydrogenase family)
LLTSTLTSGGVGKSTVKYLALAGAKVYLAARSKEKGKAVIEALHQNHPSLKDGQIVLLHLDLADVNSVIAAANEVKAKEEKLDILSN